MSAPLGKTRIWGAPIAVGFVSGIGLIAALVADGAGDAVSWVALAMPLAVALWYGVRAA